MKIYSIYKATNKANGKSYIGFDSNWPKRQIAHKHFSLVKESPNYFHRAIRKHGWETFKWEVICQSVDGDYLLNVMEPYFIQQTGSLRPNGYNLALGGGGNLGVKLTDEARLKISKALTGTKRSVETRQKMSQKSLGVKKSEAHILAKCKNWLVTNPEGTEYNIRNLTQFCIENSLEIGNMSRVASGKRKHHKNWKCSILFDS